MCLNKYNELHLFGIPCKIQHGMSNQRKSKQNSLSLVIWKQNIHANLGLFWEELSTKLTVQKKCEVCLETHCSQNEPKLTPPHEEVM